MVPYTSADDAFSTKLDFLRRQDLAQIGRQSAVASYEKLIAENAGHALIAEAMLDVAALFENENTEISMRPDPQSALGWYRRASLASPKGSAVWVKSQLLLVNRIRYDNATEARTILADIKSTKPDDSLIQAKIEHTLQLICISEKDLATAERHARNILQWYNEPNRIPKDGFIKSEIDGVIRSAGSAMVHAYVSAPMPKAERIRRISAIVDDNMALGSLQRDGKAALELLLASSELVAPEPIVQPDPHSRSRFLFILIGNILVVALLAIVYKLSRRGRTTKNA
jgi:hypothetical protein